MIISDFKRLYNNEIYIKWNELTFIYFSILDKELRTIIPKSSSVDVDDIGFKNDLSETDKTKIR